jgi:hypothetical protein
MPMDQDPGKGGTESDGSKTTKYCSYCFENGQFRDDFTSAGQMIGFVKGKLKEQGYGFLKRWFYTSHISRLDRWKS